MRYQGKGRITEYIYCDCNAAMGLNAVSKAFLILMVYWETSEDFIFER